MPPRYRTAYFKHTFGGGYGAGYYSYMWAETLVADIDQWFASAAAQESDGGLNGKAGEKLRRELFSRGSSRDPLESFTAVRGRRRYWNAGGSEASTHGCPACVSSCRNSRMTEPAQG